MSHDEAIFECEKHGLPTSLKHIENIQKLLAYIKKFEVKANSEINAKKTQVAKPLPPL